MKCSLLKCVHHLKMCSSDAPSCGNIKRRKKGKKVTKKVSFISKWVGRLVHHAQLSF